MTGCEWKGSFGILGILLRKHMPVIVLSIQIRIVQFPQVYEIKYQRNDLSYPGFDMCAEIEKVNSVS